MKKLFIFILLIPYAMLAQQGGRLIGVVYDNSGSMKDSQRIEPTEYAFKLLSSVLLEKDTLALITMCQVEKKDYQPKLFFGHNKNKIISAIDDLKYNCDTPFTAVSRLIEYLQNSKNPNKALVILTDGNFTKEYDNALNFINKEIKSESGIRAGYLINMPKATDRVKIYDQRILPTLMKKLNGNEKRGEFFIEKIDYTDLPQKMGQLFSHINGLSLNEQDKYIKFKDNTIVIKSPFPIKKIRMVYQTNQKNIPSIEKINALYEQDFLSHKLSDNYRNIQLNASGGIINFTDDVPGGQEIVITFDSTIKKQMFFIFLDIALDLKISVINKNGIGIKSVNNAYFVGADDEFYFQAEFYHKKNKFYFTPDIRSQLDLYGQKRTGNSISFFSKDYITFKSNSIKLGRNKPYEHIFDVFAKFPGHFDLQQSLVFKVATVKTYSTLNGKKNWRQNWTEVSRCTIDSIPVVIPSIIEEISGESVNHSYTYRLESKPEINHKIEYLTKNKPVISFSNYFFPWKDPSGRIKLTLIAEPQTSLYKSHSIDFFITVKDTGWWCLWWRFILAAIIILLILLKIICFFKCNKFANGARLRIETKSRRTRKFIEDINYSPIYLKRRSIKNIIFFWLLCRSMSQIITIFDDSLYLYASVGTTVKICRKDARSFDNIFLRDNSLKKLSNDGLRDVIIHRGDELSYDNNNSKCTYECGIL